MVRHGLKDPSKLLLGMIIGKPYLIDPRPSLVERKKWYGNLITIDYSLLMKYIMHYEIIILMKELPKVRWTRS